MKLFFLKEDSLYKIFKTLEKCSGAKKITVVIDPDNPFFEHARRGKQIKDLITKNQLDVCFFAKSKKVKEYYEHLGVEVQYQKPSRSIQFARILYDFFFDMKKFHLHVYTNKHLTFYLVFALEAFFGFIILYFLYLLILPSANVLVTPANTSEDIVYNFRYYPLHSEAFATDENHIKIPYRTGSFDYQYTLQTTVQNIKYFQNPSAGKVKFINNSPIPYSLIKNTQLVTQEGLLFKTLKDITVPALSGGRPGETITNVQALESDLADQIIGSRGNIATGTQLLIKNLKNSFFLKQIVAESIEQFYGGKTTNDGSVTLKDIQSLSGKLEKNLYQNKNSIIKDAVKDIDGFFLLYDETTRMDIVKTQVFTPIGSKQSNISGLALVRIHYARVQWDDLMQAVKTYLDQRPSKSVSLIDIPRSSLMLYEKSTIGNSLVIPTRMNVVWGYDFENDVNGIVAEMKHKIAGANEQDAKNIVLSYPEIATATIRINPPRYSTLPTVKSRIYIKKNRP